MKSSTIIGMAGHVARLCQLVLGPARPPAQSRSTPDSTGSFHRLVQPPPRRQHRQIDETPPVKQKSTLENRVETKPGPVITVWWWRYILPENKSSGFRDLYRAENSLDVYSSPRFTEFYLKKTYIYIYISADHMESVIVICIAYKWRTMAI